MRGKQVETRLKMCGYKIKTPWDPGQNRSSVPLACRKRRLNEAYYPKMVKEVEKSHRTKGIKHDKGKTDKGKNVQLKQLVIYIMFCASHKLRV